MNAPAENQLIIVAGPNGAGKSTYSPQFSNNAIVFDPDKENQLILDRYKKLPAESIYHFINSNFQDQIAKAVRSKKDFILETNFRDHLLMETVGQFRNEGYSASLIYFLLRSEHESMHRVTSRVAKGGHYVDPYSIRLNYEEGLKNLVYFANRFDRLLLLDATGRIGEQEPLLNINGTEIKFVSERSPKWADSIIQEVINSHGIKQKSLGKDLPPNPRGR